MALHRTVGLNPESKPKQNNYRRACVGLSKIKSKLNYHDYVSLLHM